MVYQELLWGVPGIYFRMPQEIFVGCSKNFCRKCQELLFFLFWEFLWDVPGNLCGMWMFQEFLQKGPGTFAVDLIFVC